MKASIITIGDEILIGQILDTNSAWIASSLQDLNVHIEKMMSISDEDQAIQDALRDGCASSDLVILTGGLGPTKDDITKKSIATFLGVEMTFDEDLYQLIQDMFKRFGRKPTESHRLQSYMPVGTQKLTNKMGTAPGMLFHHNGTMILSMPGVPYEMKYIFEHSFKPVLQKTHNGFAVYHKTIQTVGRGETVIADEIEHIVDSFPDHIKMAYLPSLGKVRLRISGRHKDESTLVREIDTFADQISDVIPELVFGYNQDSLASVIQSISLEKKISVSTAESCTGGNVARELVRIPGSSKYFNGGIVCYSNELKMDLLDVSEETLSTKGAVSKETVTEMLTGLLDRTKSTVGVAISGIAGPGGGTPEKPVGTIHLACGTKDNMHFRQLNLTKDRNLNIEYTTNIALMMLWKSVKRSVPD